MPSNKKYNSVVESMGLYRKEISLFDELFPQFRNKQYCCEDSLTESFYNKCGSGIKRPFWCSDCFYSKHGLIVFDDLNQYRFNVKNVCEFHDKSHCLLVIQTMAKFHAASIILEEDLAKKSNNLVHIDELFPHLVFETTYVSDVNHPGLNIIRSCEKAMIDIAEDILRPVKISNELKLKIRELNELSFQFAKKSTTFRNVLCHGDLWSHNIMFRYNNDNKPVEACFVDFQTARFVPPAYDLMSYLHLSTNKTFRNKEVSEFINFYYQNFELELSSHNISCAKIYSLENFLESCKFYRTAAIIIAAQYFQAVTLGHESVKELYVQDSGEAAYNFMFHDKSKIAWENYCKDPVFRNRLREAVEELMDITGLNIG